MERCPEAALFSIFRGEKRFGRTKTHEENIGSKMENFGKEFFFEAQDGAFAGGPFATDVERIQMMRKLTDEGWGKQIIIANDVCLKASLHSTGMLECEAPVFSVANKRVIEESASMLILRVCNGAPSVLRTAT